MKRARVKRAYEIVSVASERWRLALPVEIPERHVGDLAGLRLPPGSYIVTIERVRP